MHALHEQNPMLGLRGVRLGLVVPGLFALQVRAIAEAAAELIRAGRATRSRRSWSRWSASVQELEIIRDEAERVLAEVAERTGVELRPLIGTMIELPRAALTAGPDRRGRRVLLLRHQRPDPDHLGLLPRRRRGRVLLDLPGEGHLRGLARSRPSTSTASASWSGSAPSEGRATRPDLKVGVCGEHGGDPDSVHFFHGAGLDYVSCSPFRVPVARLEAGRVVLSGTGASAER